MPPEKSILERMDQLEDLVIIHAREAIVYAERDEWKHAAQQLNLLIQSAMNLQWVLLDKNDGGI